MPHLATLPLFVVAGAAFGLGYFALLRRQARLLVSGGSHRSGLAWAALRVGAAAGAFMGLAQFGPVALLASFAGFLGARHLALFMARHTDD